MGYAIAEQARDMGADVTLVSGPVSLSAPHGVDVIHVTTARNMFDAVQERFAQADLTIMAAAVGDFRPVEQAQEKIKKNGRVNIDLHLTSNPDILAWAGEHKTADQTLCGFAMETQDLEANAAKKLASKHCSMLVANNLNTPGAGFAVDTNVVTVLKPGANLMSQSSNIGTRWASRNWRNAYSPNCRPCATPTTQFRPNREYRKYQPQSQAIASIQ